MKIKSKDKKKFSNFMIYLYLAFLNNKIKKTLK
jgi:hypothetical protein